jgi:hypothetical protein
MRAHLWIGVGSCMAVFATGCTSTPAAAAGGDAGSIDRDTGVRGAGHEGGVKVMLHGDGGVGAAVDGPPASEVGVLDGPTGVDARKGSNADSGGEGTGADAGGSSSPVIIGVNGQEGWGGQGSTVPVYIRTNNGAGNGFLWGRVYNNDGDSSDWSFADGFNVLMICDQDINGGGVLANYQSYGHFASRVMFEFGNEVYANGSGFTGGDQSDWPRQYATGYLAAHAAKAAAGYTQPLLFMTTGTNYGAKNGSTWLDQCVAAVPGLVGHVDAFSTHTYGPANVDTNGHASGVLGAKYQHDDAVTQGFDTNLPWYISEYGFDMNPSQSSFVEYVSSYADQVTQIQAGYAQLLSYSWVRGVWYYQVHDDSTGYYGLMTSPGAADTNAAGQACGTGNGSPTPVITRPSWDALIQIRSAANAQ